MLKKLFRIDTRTEFKNPWWEYRLDKYRMPSGKISEYHYVFTHGSTFVIPILYDGRFVMTNQYRYLVQRESIEFPGGGQEKELSQEANARKELLEETGYEAGSLKYIGEFNPYNGVTNEMCKVFLAEGLIKGKVCPEESEEFEILSFTREEIFQKIKGGEIWDGMTLAAWSIFLQH